MTVLVNNILVQHMGKRVSGNAGVNMHPLDTVVINASKIYVQRTIITKIILSSLFYKLFLAIFLIKKSLH